MIDIYYGISDVQVEGETGLSKVVKFGDGKTTILSNDYQDGTKGISFHRDKNSQPFVKCEYQEGTTTSDFGGEKVFIVFDNNKSIDAMISMLELVRDSIEL